MQPAQAVEVQIGAVQDVKRAGFIDQMIERAEVGDAAVGDADEAGDGAAQIEQSVEFDRSAVVTEGRPGAQRQAQIDAAWSRARRRYR